MDTETRRVAASSRTPSGSPSGVRRITPPTLYVWSDGDMALGRVAAEETGDYVDGPYRFEVLPGISHWIPEAAPDRLTQGNYDAVLMDMVLPGINGVEAIRRIRTMAMPLAQIPIIGVSGRGEDEVASREAGADAFLVKPVSPRALATALLAATRREEAAT